MIAPQHSIQRTHKVTKPYSAERESIKDWTGALEGVKRKRSGGYMALCPAHDDKNPSLSLDVGDDGKVLVKCFAGCEYEVIKAAVFDGRHPTPSGGVPGGRAARPKSELKVYTTEEVYSKHVFEFKLPSGEVAYVQRHKGSYFHPMGGNRWVSGLEGVNPIPYNLSGLLDGVRAAELVFHVEGCKDVDTATRLGLTATTTGGANTWRPEFAQFYTGADVVILPDNDPPGRAYAETVAADLACVARSVKVVELPGLPPGGDLTDFKEGGGTKEDLLAIVEAAPTWSPANDAKDSLGAEDVDPEEEARRRAEAAWETCRDLARRRDLTTDFARDLHRSGVAGETRQIRLLYLTITSRRLDKPVSVAVKGQSSGGKSHLVEKVLGSFPESAYYALTAMSEKALIYLDEDMRHRFLVIYEASGMAGDMQTYLMRTLLSENRIRYQTAESTSKGVRPRLLELEGPTGLLVTTTQTRMHPENETRLFSLLVTDDRNQTKAIFRAIADQDREPVDMEVWRDLQAWIEGQPCEVYIPYAGALAELIPPVAVRLRRDFLAVLQLVRAHAVLHQASRERDDKGRIVATLDDYRIVRSLVADLVAEGVDATVNPTIRETVRAVERLVADEPNEDLRYVSVKKLAGELKLDKASTSRRVKAARDGGYLVNLEDRKGKPAMIAIGEPLPANLVILPEVKELVATWGCCSVAGENGGRGGSSSDKHRSVANGDCNTAQRCNTYRLNSGETPQKHVDNGIETPQDGAEEGVNTHEGGRGSFESATPQHSPQDAPRKRNTSATQHPAQHPAACIHGDPGGCWWCRDRHPDKYPRISRKGAA